MFSDASSKFGDSDFDLLRKISQSLGNVNSNETEVTLLIKICSSTSTLYAGGQNPPEFRDSKNDLLFKIAKSLSLA